MPDIYHRPPVEQWPIVSGPDCPTCGRSIEVTWLGTAISMQTSTLVNIWECGRCYGQWPIPVTYWPVEDGPDCPTCNTTVTCWAALEPDQGGDLWLCEEGHEFVLTPEGLIVLPGDAA